MLIDKVVIGDVGAKEVPPGAQLEQQAPNLKSMSLDMRADMCGDGCGDICVDTCVDM